MYGTNNFPDCSNMCHEPSRGLPGTVGVGKGTVTLDDFEHADTLLIFGQNPATNHPRMLGELRDAASAAPPSSRSTRCASAGWNALPAGSTRWKC
jgi:anaerobic selenocysteine-containing dehydrogenase